MHTTTTSDSVVVRIGDSALKAASYVSELRGWANISASSLPEASMLLSKLQYSTALITTSLNEIAAESLIKFAETIAQRAPELAFGFLYGRSSKQLFEAAKRISEMPIVAYSNSPQLAFAHNDFRDFISGAHVTDAGSLARTPLQVAQLIENSADLLYLIGHSNGHDQGLSKVVLCCQSIDPRPANSNKSFPCYNGAKCRFEKSEYQKVSAHTLAAKHIVNLTCWGVTLAEYPFSIGLSVGEGFLRYAPNLQSLLTTVRAASIHRTDFLVLYYLCNLGLPLGVVANKANQHRLKRGYRGDVLCFGDPATRLSQNILEVAPESVTDKMITCQISQSADCDIRVSLPPNLMIDETMAVLEEGDGANAALLAFNSLFASLSARNKSCDLIVRLFNRSELQAKEQALGEIFRDLRYFDRFLCAAAKLGYKQKKNIMELSTAVAELGELMQSWPLATMDTGTVVIKDVWEGLWNDLSVYLKQLAAKMLLLFTSIPSRSGMYSMTAVQPYSRRVAEAAADTPCQYCGSLIDEELWSPLFEQEERRFGLCQACGPIYEGDVRMGKWLSANSKLVAGSASKIDIKITNPYCISVPARGTVILGSFRGKGERAALSREIELEPRSSGVLKAKVAVPANCVPGIYYLKAAYIVGARANYLRRPIEVIKRKT